LDCSLAHALRVRGQRSDYMALVQLVPIVFLIDRHQSRPSWDALPASTLIRALTVLHIHSGLRG
jgi:hypothetical protein